MKQIAKERIVKNSFWNFSSAVISKFGGLIFTVLLARFLLPEGFGIYSIVLSIAMIFATFSDLGVGQTLMRYVSYALVRDKRKIPSFYRYLLKIKIVLTLTFSLLAVALSYPLAAFVFKNSSLFLPLIVSSFYIFIYSLEGFYNQLFYSIEKVKYVSIREVLSQTSRILFVLPILIYPSVSYKVAGVFIALSLSSFVLFLYSWGYSRKLIPQLNDEPKTSINEKKILRFVGYLTIASISAVFFSYVDSIMLGLFVSAEFVGYYRAAFSLVISIAAMISFPNLVLLPIFTKIKRINTIYLLNKTIKYISILTFPSIFGLIILGKYFIRMFYGYSYLPSVIPLYVLSFLIFPTVAVGLFLSLFSARGKPEIFAKLMLLMNLINVGLNFIFIKLFLLISPIWATFGASLATLISWVIYFVYSVYYIKKDLRYSISLGLILKPFIASILMSLLLWYILPFFKDINLIKGALLVSLGALFYFLFLFVIKGISKEDINVIRLFLK